LGGTGGLNVLAVRSLMDGRNEWEVTNRREILFAVELKSRISFAATAA